MTELLANLAVFNRRERFFVVGWALDNPGFTLGAGFRAQLEADLRISVPADAFCAMDFPMDWLVGCLWLTQRPQASYSILETGEVNRNNEDVDLLIAHEARGTTHLLMIEAKGVTGWKNKQLAHKAARLGSIFGMGRPDEWPAVEPRFVLASPRPPQYVDASAWPAWMQEAGRPRDWLEMKIPENLRKIERCDEDGRRNADGEYWKIV